MIAAEAVTLRSHPFPGLRSFTEQEVDHFFGREGQSNEIVRLLERSRFVAVVGTSGCGKSSLVKAGLLPALFAGYASRAGSKWQVVDFHPGGDPLGNLACALHRARLLKSADSAMLRSASAAVVNTVEQARADGRLVTDENVVLLVDQFEELFRGEEGEKSAAVSPDEKAQFVALLLEAVRLRESRIFVVLTLRAEFLGDCAQFRDLPETINRSQYLVPRMTRQQRRAAIEGPVRLAGADIAPRLVQRLLNELGEDPDQLPVLQHALMRTWDAWLKRGQLSEAVDFTDYESIGTLSEALDRHADEAFKDASNLQGKTLVKRIFQRLSFRDDKGRERRSPATVEELCVVTGTDLDQVRTVVDCFRDDEAGRTFLTPFKSQVSEIGPETEIDIIHESLLRRWNSLAGWVIEEEESRRIFVRLTEWAEGDAASQSLLRGSLLQRGLEWWNERQPNPAWAARYHPGFASAKKYLFNSRDRYNRAQLLRNGAPWFIAIAVAGLVIGLSWIRTMQQARRDAETHLAETSKAREEAVAYLLASKAALAAGGDGAGLATGLLLATASLQRLPTLEAQQVVTNALALLPPPLASPSDLRARQVAFGVKGELLALLGDDGRLRWGASGKVFKPSTRPLAGIASFALARNAAMLVGLGKSGTVTVLDAAAGREIAQFACSGEKSAVGISGNGSVAAALCGNELRVWKSSRSRTKAKGVPVRMPKGSWTNLALDSLGQVIALGRAATQEEEFAGVSSVLAVIDLRSGRLIKELRFKENLGAMVFLPFNEENLFFEEEEGPGRDSLAVGSDRGSVWVFEIPKASTSRQGLVTDVEAAPAFKHSVGVTALSSNEDGTQLVAGYRDGVAEVWDLNRNREVARLIGNEPVISVAMSNKAGRVSLVGRDLRLQTWDLTGLNDSIPLEGLGAAWFYTDVPLLLYRSYSKGYGVLDVRNRRTIGVWEDRIDRFAPVAISPAGTMAAIRGQRISPPTSYQALLDVRTLSSGKVGASSLWPKPVAVDGQLGHPVFSPDGKHIASYVLLADSGLREVRSMGHLEFLVWRAVDGAQEIRRSFGEYKPGQWLVFGFTPDSRRIFIGSEDGKLKSLSLADKTERDVLIVPERSVRALAFSPDGKLLATASGGEKHSEDEEKGPAQALIHLRSYPSGRHLGSFTQTGSVGQIAFSPDSKYLMSANSDQSIAVWNLERWQQEAQIPALADVLAITFARDQKIAVAEEGQVIFHPWKPGDLIDEACRRVRRNLTREEWKSYLPKKEEYFKACLLLP